MPRKTNDQLADNLHDVMMETLPSLVKEKVTEQVTKEVLAQVQDQVPVYLAKGLIMERKTTKEETERLISKAILTECGHMQAQISSQIQNAIDNAIPSLVDASVLSYMSDIAIWLALQMKFEKTQVPHTACRPSVIRPRDQDDPHDDAHPEGENSAKRQKTSEYKAYVSGESSSGQVNVEEPSPPTLVQSCQRDPEAPALSLINQDLLYLKKGNSGLRRLFLSLHKFQHCLSMINIEGTDIPDGLIVYKEFNPYARLEFKMKNHHAKIFYIEIVARRANKLHSVNNEPDFKKTSKANDIEDMYLLIMNNKVPDYADTGLLWSLSVFIRIWIWAIELTNDELELLMLCIEEEIEGRLTYQDQMRRWESSEW
ncbi:hypothetical protein Tco_0421266 [Tanacetum coccineum]